MILWLAIMLPHAPGLANTETFSRMSASARSSDESSRVNFKKCGLDLANRHALRWLSRVRTMGNSPWIFSERSEAKCSRELNIGSSSRFQPCGSFKSRSWKTLKGKVKWVDDLNTLPVFDGIHFSNELVDSFPFHLIRSNGTGWDELCVSTDADRFVFEVARPSTVIADALQSLPARPAGTIAELRPAACDWVHALAERMNKGFVLIVDYGFPRVELLAPHRTNGTFSCYRAHRRDSRPLEDPGEKDISAHVDFTALGEAALAAGFRIEGFADQHHYLVGASHDFLEKTSHPPDELSQKNLRALQTLLHPESMGTQFHYLALSKGVALAALSGFKFARDAGKQLFAEVH